MKKQIVLTDVQFFWPYTRLCMDKKHVITDYRGSGYREGDMLLDILKEGLVEKFIATDALPSADIVNIADIIQYFNVQNPTMQDLMKGSGAMEGSYGNQ